MSSRRYVIASVGALLSTGCLSRQSPDRQPTSTTRHDASPQSSTGTSTGTGDCNAGVLLEATPFEPTKQLLWPVGERERELVERAVAADGVTVETVAAEPSVPGGVYVELDGTYYETSVTATGRTEVPARTFDVSWKKGREPPSDAAVVWFDDLPASDRAALELVVYGPPNERRQLPTEGFEATDAPAPYPDGTADSTLVEREHVWVAWKDRFFEVRVGESTTDTVRTFEVAASAVARSDSAFREHATETYVVALEDLSSNERGVLEAALAGEYRTCEPVPAGYESLRSRLPDERELPHPSGGRWYVAYEGKRYQLAFVGWEA